MSLPEEQMTPETARCYRAILVGLIGAGYHVRGAEESGNVDGHWIIETEEGISIEFGPSYEPDDEDED